MVLSDRLGKNLDVAVLLDYYGELLTEKQKNFLYYYYEEDLSLSEIASNYGISRQCVHDTIKSAHTYLLEFEKKLKLAEKFKKILENCNEIKSLNEHFLKSEKLDEIVLKIENVAEDFA